MHAFSTTRLVLGLLFLAVSGLWLADRAGWVGDSSYLLPILLILVGLVGLVAFALRGLTRRPRRSDAEPPSDLTTHHITDSTTDEEHPR